MVYHHVPYQNSHVEEFLIFRHIHVIPIELTIVP